MKRIKRVGLSILLGSVLLISLSGFQVESSLPTFMYYGRVLSPTEFGAMYEAGHYLHCVQQITERTILYDEHELDFCFDTQEEADANYYSQSEQVQRYNEAYAQRQPPPVVPPEELGISKADSILMMKRAPLEQSCIFVGYWQVFAQHSNQTLLATLCNGQSANVNAVWSSSRNVNPNAINYCSGAGQTGFCRSMTTPEFAMVAMPFGNGGALSARVF